jgi:hypothetical protein
MKTKSLPLLLSCLLSINLLVAQPNSGGPDTFGYTYRNDQATNGPAYQWFDISTIGTLVSGLSDDNFVGPYTISGFSYYTTTPTQLYIGSNGYIAFNPVNISSSAAQFPAIPTAGGPNDFIAPMLTDLTFGGASTNPAQCYFYNQGDTIAVSWEGVPFWTNNTNQYAGDNSFQVILNKRDSSITFNYKKQSGSPDPTYTTNYLSIGIENSTGNDGLQYYRGTTFPVANTTVKYYYPSIVAPLTDLAIDWVNNPDNGGVFKMVGQIDTARLNVKNAGNQAITGSFNVGYQLISSNGLIIDNSSTSINGLAVGADTTIVFNKAIPLGVANRYELRGFVSPITNDNVRINDSLSIRYIALDTASFRQTLDYTDTTGPFFSISWIGGNGGVGAYFEPPYYPARILSTNFYITVTGNANGFHSVLYDNTGRQGAIGNILDSAFISAANIIPQTYTRNPINNLTVTSGGLYLLWLMDGSGIGLGRSLETTASQRTYEVLNGAWSRYRDADDEDFAMGIDIAPLSTGLKDGISSLNNFKVYPNPAVEQVTIQLQEPLGQRDYQLMDLSGRNVEAKILTFGNELKLYRGNLEAGLYLIRVGKSIAKVQFTD